MSDQNPPKEPRAGHPPAPASGGLSPQQRPGPWDAVAPTYAEDMSQWKDWAHEALRLLPVGPTDRVLDVACGPGTLAFELAARAAHVEAIDFSPGMIAVLNERVEREGLTNVEASVMDAQSLELPDASFDAAYCLFAYFFFPDRARAFAEMHRILRPGGRALIATWAPIEKRPLMKLGFDAAAEALPTLPRPGKGDLQDPDECVREMSAAGFRDVTAQTFTASVRFESAERYVELIARSTAPLAAAKKTLDAATWETMMARLTDAVRKRMPEGGAELSAEAIYTVGRR